MLCPRHLSLGRGSQIRHIVFRVVPIQGVTWGSRKELLASPSPIRANRVQPTLRLQGGEQQPRGQVEDGPRAEQTCSRPSLQDTQGARLFGADPGLQSVVPRRLSSRASSG